MATNRAVFEQLETRQLMAATPVLDYSSYFGAAGSDTVLAVASDSAGNTYVAGSTTSSAFAVGGFDTTYSGGSFSGDAIVAKFAPDGKPIWSTYLGNGFGLLEEANSIALDNDGNVYVAGQSSSTGWTAGGYDVSYGGGAADGFVAKLSNAGQLAWSTYVGGSKDDQVFDLHVTGKGVVTVVGETRSSDFASGGFDSVANGGTDAFVTRLSTKGAHLSTSFIGGAGEDRAHGVAMGFDGSLFVVGETTSTSGFIAGGADTAYGAFIDGFVLQIKPDGTKGWSTYLGGNEFDIASAVRVASDGQLIVAGSTGTSGWTSGGFDTSYNGGGDGFVMRMTPAGQTVWSTYFGGNGSEDIKALAISSDGAIAVVGGGGGSWASGGPLTTSAGGVGDGFALQLTSAGQHKWSTFTGGSQTDYNYGVAFDSQNRMLVAGFTSSTAWVGGGADSTYGGNTDGFVARYSAFEPFVTMSNGIATVQGTESNDAISASIKTGKLFVSRNGVTQKLSSSGLTRVEIFANGGNDNVLIGALVPSSYINGGAGNDTLQGGDGNDSLTGGAGKDSLFGGNGDDRVAGSAGHDRVFGEAGNDRLYGDAGNDFLDGGGNADRLWGGDGDDVLAGGGSLDRMYGGLGNDTLDGGKSADYLFGEDGTDTALTDATDIRETIEILQ
ncbi:MAG: SBBP repeat-containing protein [Anaerolineae bacterium]|nr:SBBP repeat-containing protein [Phycisphaerae bacterium]